MQVVIAGVRAVPGPSTVTVTSSLLTPSHPCPETTAAVSLLVQRSSPF